MVVTVARGFERCGRAFVGHKTGGGVDLEGRGPAHSILRPQFSFVHRRSRNGLLLVLIVSPIQNPHREPLRYLFAQTFPTLERRRASFLVIPNSDLPIVSPDAYMQTSTIIPPQSSFRVFNCLQIYSGTI